MITLYIIALVAVCKLNKLENARCNDKDNVNWLVDFSSTLDHYGLNHQSP